MENIVELIDSAILKEAMEEPHRQYMGASGLGEQCDAKLWYSYKFPKIVEDPRIHRIFHMGHSLENKLVKYIRKTRLTIHTHNSDGTQFGFVDGIIAGHIDGVVELDEPTLIEFKTYNAKRFDELKKSGVQKSDPKYYTQICVYMEKMELQKCIFMAMCKNDCEIYTEEVGADPIEANWAINRGKEIGEKNERPDRKYGHKSNFNCKMCNWRKDCWSDADEKSGE